MKTTKQNRPRKPKATPGPRTVTLTRELASSPFWRQVKAVIDSAGWPSIWRITIGGTDRAGVAIHDDGSAMNILFPDASDENFAVEYIIKAIFDHARDLLPDNEEQLRRKNAGELMEPGESSPPEDKPSMRHDRGPTMDLVVKALRDHVPPNNPTRFDIGPLLAARDGNGDYAAPEDAEDIEEVIGMFRAMPEAEQRRCLNGWSPAVLGETSTDADAEAPNLPTIPCLWILRSARDVQDFPSAAFGVMEEGHILNVCIATGRTKAEVMGELERIANDLDHHWDALISNPSQEKGGAK